VFCTFDLLSTNSHLILHSLNADVFNCHSRYLALPTRGWIQYAVEGFSLYIAVFAILRRLHEVRREIEVCHPDLVSLPAEI
jgi:hypothetical protein